MLALNWEKAMINTLLKENKKPGNQKRASQLVIEYRLRNIDAPKAEKINP